jgi:hypothetical protein
MSLGHLPAQMTSPLLSAADDAEVERVRMSVLDCGVAVTSEALPRTTAEMSDGLGGGRS